MIVCGYWIVRNLERNRYTAIGNWLLDEINYYWSDTELSIFQTILTHRIYREKMKMVYFIMGGENPNSGVSKKIFAQLSALIDIGLDAKLVMFNFSNVQYPSYAFLKIFQIERLPTNDIFGRIKRLRKIRTEFSETIKSLDSCDIMYFRHSITSLLYYPFNYLKIFRDCKFVTEHQTIERNEFKLNHLNRKTFKDIFFERILRGQSDAIVGVTDEITDYQITCSGDPHKPHITIGNGINVKSCSLRQPPKFNNHKIDLLFVASVNRWHGLDRLIQGLAIYNGPTKITLHIAGDGTELPTIQKLTNELGIANQVIFYGFKTGEDLDLLFNTCHIAVGSLGMHRIGLTEASILKAREYCSRGIPYIIACADPDFQDDFPYIYRIPSDESPVDIEKVIEFAKRVYADPYHPQKMRAYAVEHLDWSVKMKKLKTFLETLVDESKSTS